MHLHIVQYKGGPDDNIFSIAVTLSMWILGHHIWKSCAGNIKTKYIYQIYDKFKIKKDLGKKSVIL